MNEPTSKALRAAGQVFLDAFDAAEEDGGNHLWLQVRRAADAYREAAAIPPEQDGYAEGRAREVLESIALEPHLSPVYADIQGIPVVSVTDAVRAMLTFATDRHAEGRIAGLEEAARICEQQARDFLSEQYATPQPIGSIMERFACTECATAIRAQANGGPI